jgi:hypothetical protein
MARNAFSAHRRQDHLGARHDSARLIGDATAKSDALRERAQNGNQKWDRF